LICAPRDAGVVQHLPDDPSFAYVWCAAILAGVAAMLLVGDARIFLIVWAAGGIVAVLVADVRLRRRSAGR
jgi:hypothetical protein